MAEVSRGFRPVEKAFFFFYRARNDNIARVSRYARPRSERNRRPFPKRLYDFSGTEIDEVLCHGIYIVSRAQFRIGFRRPSTLKRVRRTRNPNERSVDGHYFPGSRIILYETGRNDEAGGTLFRTRASLVIKRFIRYSGMATRD